MKWILEKPLFFENCMLQVKPDAKGTTNSRCLIKQRLSYWEQEKFQILTYSAITCAEAKMRK